MRSWRGAHRYDKVEPKPLWNGQLPKPLPPEPPPALVPIAPSQPLLDCNAQPVRDLRRLIELEGQRYVERQLDVHRTTVARWLAGSFAIPGAKALAVRGLLGDLPGTAGAWTGWRFAHGELLSPAGDAYKPGEVLAIRVQQQRVKALSDELRELRLRVKTLEKTLDLYGPAANESQTA